MQRGATSSAIWLSQDAVHSSRNTARLNDYESHYNMVRECLCVCGPRLLALARIGKHVLAHATTQSVLSFKSA